uniref:Ankyrin-2-like n=1 Tax=Drosophila rhopaloa TaxID=1041015 RepID=A0A6P4FJY1_DRORH
MTVYCAQPVDPDLTAKLLGRGVAVSPIVTVEPRRRKFHKAITLSMPAPKAHSQGMINQYSGNTPTLRLLCSITGGPSRAQWEDVTGSTPLTFVNDCVSFTTTVSARFWLMDCRNISDATKMATELYKEVIHVPFIAKFVVFAKKIEPFEARLRVFCMTDDREDKTLEKHELYTEVAKSRDVEVLEGKPQYIEMAGNLVPVTKSGDQLQLQFKAFRENRLPFTVRVKDQHADIVGRTLFMKEPKVAKGEPPQQPICILNIVLPEAVIPDSTTAFSDRVTSAYRTSMFSLSKHQNDHYIGDIRIVDLSNLLGKDWIQLAPEIGINSEEIDEIINHNTDSIARQAQSMIRLYKDKPNYDILSLETALKNIGRDDIMKKCKSGRLSHSREFDDTDIMKNSESVEELVRRESKRIQQINEREEVKYSAEEKEVEESESDEEAAKRTVAERREKIVKRLSVERSIPASTQKREINREITEIKRKSLIEDKKAHHESEILMQLPADNVIIKTTTVPDQVIKMKMGKMDSTEVSKSEFEKELTHKFKTSGRSSEEEDQPSSPDQTDKIIQDISAAEKKEKDGVTFSRVTTITRQEARDITEDFLEIERNSQLPVTSTTATVHEKFVEEVKEKTSPLASVPQETIKEVQQVISEVTEIASKKVENIISSFETSKPVEATATLPTQASAESTKVSETIKHLEDAKTVTQEQVKTIQFIESSSIEETIAEFEAKKVKYDFHGGEPKTQIPKFTRKSSEDSMKPTAAPRATVEADIDSLVETKSEKPISKIPVKTTPAEAQKAGDVDARKMTQDFLQGEKLAAEPKAAPAAPAASKIPKVEPRKSVDKQMDRESKILDDVVASTATIMTAGLGHEQLKDKPVEQPEVIAKAETLNEKVSELINTFQKIEEKVTKSEKSSEIASKVEELVKIEDKPLAPVQPKEDKVAEKVAEVVETFYKIEEQITTAEARKLTHDFLSMEQQSQLPSIPQAAEKPLESSLTSTSASEPDSIVTVKSSPPASKIPVVEPRKTLTEETPKPLIETEPVQATEKKALNERQLTADFLSMEQQTQLVSEPAKKLVEEVMKTAEQLVEQPKEQKPWNERQLTEDFLIMEQQTQLPSKLKEELIDGIESAAPVGDGSPFHTPKLTTTVVTQEPQHLTSEYDSDTFGKEATVPLRDIIKEEGLTAPVSVEPRKSLTDAEFCKSVGETITKKMSVGVIEISDELKKIGSEIPHSQTPPPTPSDTKTDKQSEEPELISLERDYLADTVTTLHTTTESTFERVSAITKIEMSTSSQTPKTTTTTILTAQIDRTQVDLTIPEKDQLKEKIKDQPSVDVDADAEKSASDREYLEQIMGCGDVRRKIMRLESTGSTESLESIGKQAAVTPKFIGDNVPVVREVVQSIEDKICSTVVSAIPFTVQKRQPEDSDKELDVVELEKQILTPADLALEKLIKCEPPAVVAKISPIEAMEHVGLGLKEIEEEVCEKVCEKRKAFVVAEDLCETEKTLTEQVIELNRHVEQVPGKILTETVEEHLDIEGKDVKEALPKVREVVQDFERRYPASSLEAKPFSARKRVTPERKADVSSIEQQILSDADLIFDVLGSKHVPEPKVQSPVFSMENTSGSTENLEGVCEKKCSKRTISDMAKAFEKQEDAETPSVKDIKSATVMFLEHESVKLDITESIKEFEAKSILNEGLTESIKDTKLVEFPKIAHTLERLHSISKTDVEDTKEFAHVASEHEAKMDRLVDNRAHLTALKGNQILEKDIQVKFPTQDKTDELQTYQCLAIKTSELVQMTDTQNKFPSEVKTDFDKQLIESDSDEEIDNLQKINKLKHLSKTEQTSILDETRILESTQKSDITKFPTTNDIISFKVQERSPALTNIESVSTIIKSKDSKIRKPLDLNPSLKDDKLPITLGDKPKSPVETVTSSQKEYSDDESDEEFGITQPQDKHAFQPTSLVTPLVEAGDKSSVKVGEKPKSLEMKDEKLPTKLEDKPKSPIESVKPTVREYSDDESYEEFGIPKPHDKPVSEPLPSVIPTTSVPDKSPLKDDVKPKEVTVFKVEEGSTTIQTNISSSSTIVISIDSKISKPLDPIAGLKDDKLPTSLEDKPKSPVESVTFSQKEYSDDESDEEFGITQPQDKHAFQPTSLVTPQVEAGDKSSVKVDEKPKSLELKDEKLTTKLEDKPKSPIESVKPTVREYSDDESDEEFGIPKPHDKPVSEPTPSVIPTASVPDKSPLKDDVRPKEVTVFKAEESSTTIQSNIKSASTVVESIDSKFTKAFDPFASLKDDKLPTTLGDKPRSPVETVTSSQKEYSDDESDEEFGIIQPQDKHAFQPTSLVTPQVEAGDKSSLKADEKPKSLELKDEKLTTKLQDKAKSPIQSVSSTTIQRNIKSAGTVVESIDSKITKPLDPFASLKDDKLPTSFEDKPKSPVESVTFSQKEYSDDESDEEFGITQPQDKHAFQPTSLVTPQVEAGDKSSLKADEKPKSLELKDEKLTTKLEDKPKSPIESAKPSVREYSDNESDEEFGIPKPHDKPVSEPTPSVIPTASVPDKSPLKDDLRPKEVTVFKAEESSTTIQSNIKSSSTIVESIDIKISKPLDPFAGLKDDKLPTSLQDKPKSPVESVTFSPKEYSNDESDEEFGITQPQDKHAFQPTSLVTPQVEAGDKSSVKVDEKPKSLELKDEKLTTKLEDKPKSPIESAKPSVREYSDNESDEEFGIPKPHDKPVSEPTPSVIPTASVPDKSPPKDDLRPKEVTVFKAEESSTTIQSNIKSSSTIVESIDSKISKPLDPFAGLKDDKLPTSLEDKPKLPGETVTLSQKEYSDDENDEEFGITQPQDKHAFQPTSLVSPLVEAGDKSSVKVDEKTKSLELKDEKLPTKLEDKPKSPIESVKPTVSEYSDDKSDEEFGIPKPHDKPVSEPIPSVIPTASVPDKSPFKDDLRPKEVTVFKVEESSTTIQSNIKSASTILESIDSKISKPLDPIAGLKDDKLPTSLGDKPKSPVETVTSSQKEYSNDENEKEFGITQPQDKHAFQPTSSVTPLVEAGDKSSVKVDEKPKSLELKDEKLPTKLEDKPKSLIESVKPTVREYSDDESDEEFGIPKPHDKPVSEPLPSVIPTTSVPDKSPLKDDVKPKEVTVFKVEESSTTIQSNIKSASTIVESIYSKISKPLDPIAGLKDDKLPTSLGDKPKSPVET